MKHLTVLTLAIICTLSLVISVPSKAKETKEINLSCANVSKHGFIKLDAYEKIEPNNTIKLILVIPKTEVKRFLMLTVKAKYLNASFYTLNTNTDKLQVFGCTPSDAKMVDFGVIVNQ